MSAELKIAATEFEQPLHAAANQISDNEKIRQPNELAAALKHVFPKGPVFGWDNFSRSSVCATRTVEELPYQTLTTNGRAAIYQALMQLKMESDALVLVPTYHCPTMVAPVILAGATPAFFAITADGLPKLDSIPASVTARAAAILVPHYFGLPQSLARIRAWCDHHRVALIEDCAHSLFGNAGERGVGAWGDFATASLSKFLPLPEAGLLASAHHAILPLQLHRRSATAQIKGFVDVLEMAARFNRIGGLNTVVRQVLKFKNKRHRPVVGAISAPESSEDFMTGCDMGRADDAPLWASKILARAVPRDRIIARRRENYQQYAAAFRRLQITQGAQGAHALRADMPAGAAPYVFPLWVEDADSTYHALRLQGYPIFRWDRLWPGTPELVDDVGMLWSNHVLQLLCHQDLSLADIDETAAAVCELLRPSNRPQAR